MHNIIDMVRKNKKQKKIKIVDRIVGVPTMTCKISEVGI
jgi:hypothetical protein